MSCATHTFSKKNDEPPVFGTRSKLISSTFLFYLRIATIPMNSSVSLTILNHLSFTKMFFGRLDRPVCLLVVSLLTLFVEKSSLPTLTIALGIVDVTPHTKRFRNATTGQTCKIVLHGLSTHATPVSSTPRRSRSSLFPQPGRLQFYDVSTSTRFICPTERVVSNTFTKQ